MIGWFYSMRNNNNDNVKIFLQEAEVIAPDNVIDT